MLGNIKIIVYLISLKEKNIKIFFILKFHLFDYCEFKFQIS